MYQVFITKEKPNTLTSSTRATNTVDIDDN